MTTDPNIPDPDGFYAALVAAHEGLAEAQSAELNARLVFLLANQVGDQPVLLACVAAARRPYAPGAWPHEAPRPDGLGSPS